jgi:hypothetical protein
MKNVINESKIETLQTPQGGKVSKITPLKAIRLKCLDCTGHQKNEIKACPSVDCPLWKFRLNIHPFTKKNLSNPFLEPNNFVGLENRTSSEVIKIIGDKYNK